MARFPRPHANRDYAPFYDGIQQRHLIIQKCENCATLQFPPAPMCSNCNHIGWTYQSCRTNGLLHSYTIHYHPPMEGFETPHPVGLVDMADGFRLLAGIHGVPLEDIRINMPLQLEFVQVEPDYILHRFTDPHGAGTPGISR